MVGALLVVALLFYAVLYSGLSDLRGAPVGIWDSLTGATPGPGTAAAVQRQHFAPGLKAGPNPAGAAIVAAGRQWIGTPYKLGGVGPPGPVDCSGFTMRAYLAATGYKLPHNAAQQFAACTRIRNPSEGDLYFCSINAQLDHVGIVVGGNTVIDSVGSNGGVTEHARGPNEAKIVAYGRPRFLVQNAPAPGPPQAPRPGPGHKKG